MKMKRALLQPISLVMLAIFGLTACKKDIVPPPTSNPKPIPGKPPGQQSVETIDIQLQAVITIGTINYDSLPASFRIVSWDAQGVAHQKDTVLAAGVNKVPVIKGHSRYQFSVNKWGITDAITFTKEQLQQDVIYTLGGGKPAKLLKKEESFIFASAAYRPQGKVIYTYNSKGLAQAAYYQKLPEYMELQFTQKHIYTHTFNYVTRIDVLDNMDKNIGYTTFDYNTQGTKITNMHEVKQSGETYSVVQYDYLAGGAEITIDYVFDNGHSMEYKMQFKGGNKVSDAAVTSRAGQEGGTYQYDLNINPYAHMNKPNSFLTHLSKNNLIGQQKGYSGAMPSAEPYKFDYTYDEEGYPVELIKYYKNFLTGEELYKTKTVFYY